MVLVKTYKSKMDPYMNHEGYQNHCWFDLLFVSYQFDASSLKGQSLNGAWRMVLTIYFVLLCKTGATGV